MKIEVFAVSEDTKSKSRIFALTGRPATLPNDNAARVVTPANAITCPSILIRSLCSSVYEQSRKNMVESVQFKRSSHKPEADLILVTLQKDFSWDTALESRVQDIIRKRLPGNMPLILDSSVRRDFARATDAEIKEIVTAISPPAVEVHNGSDPKSGLIVERNGIQRNQKSLTVIMGEACTGGGTDCNSLSYRATEKAIKSSLAYFFPDVKVTCVPR